MRIDIKSRWNGSVLFSFEAEINDIRITLQAAVKAGANLNWANLSGANLSEADLSRADLSRANLSEANLSRADLSWANLSGANLSGADLSWANLSGANLSWANLSGANMSEANLSWANLSEANLSGAKNLPVASDDEIARLDQVREIVMADKKRLDMSKWHGPRWDYTHTPEEERGCGTPHCIAGWLQALSPDEALRKMDPRQAGDLLAPASTFMFTQSNAFALKWLEDRLYDQREAIARAKG